MGHTPGGEGTAEAFTEAALPVPTEIGGEGCGGDVWGFTGTKGGGCCGTFKPRGRGSGQLNLGPALSSEEGREVKGGGGWSDHPPFG